MRFNEIIGWTPPSQPSYTQTQTRRDIGWEVEYEDILSSPKSFKKRQFPANVSTCEDKRFGGFDLAAPYDKFNLKKLKRFSVEHRLKVSPTALNPKPGEILANK